MVQCSKCGKTDSVTIGQKQFCASCGNQMNTGASSTAAMTDIRQPSGPAVAAPTGVPTTSGPVAAPGVLDLRQSPPQPTPTTNQPPVPVQANQSPPANLVEAKSSKLQARLGRAASIEKSQLIQKFTRPAHPSASTPTMSSPAAPSAQPQARPVVTPPPVVSPTPIAATPVTPTPATPPVAPITPPTPPVTSPVNTQPAITVGAPPTARPASPQPFNTPVAPRPLPAHVATQVTAMSQLVPATLNDPQERAATRKAALDMAMSGPKPSVVAAVAVAIALMGGFIWYRNYPNLAAKMAAGRAGIDANLPGYMPASYSLKGPIAYASGQVRFRYGSTSGDSLLVTVRRTNWDSASLLANYVGQQTSEYLAVQNQGLTIYFYEGNQATWVNQGMWYSIEGQSKLNREQILRIIDSL